MTTFTPVRTSQRPLGEKIAQRIWAFVRVFVFGVSPWFARRWRIAWVKLFAMIRAGSRGVSWNCSISRSSRIDYPWNVSVGSFSSIGDNVWVYALDKIAIGANCCIGEGVRLLTGSHDVDSPCFDLVVEPITIGDNAWIATGAIVLPGITIGEGAVVAAGSVVAKDVEPWTVVGGNPAKVIKKRVLSDSVSACL